MNNSAGGGVYVDWSVRSEHSNWKKDQIGGL